MTTKEIQNMPPALRILAGQIKAPDHLPAMCLRDAAAMIESLDLQANQWRSVAGKLAHRMYCHQHDTLAGEDIIWDSGDDAALADYVDLCSLWK